MTNVKKFASRELGFPRCVIPTQWLGMCMFAALVAMTASCGGPDDIGPLNKDVAHAMTPPDAGTTVDASTAPAVECLTDNDCDDGKKPTIDSCTSNKCVHALFECYPGFVFNEVGKCVDVQVICPSLDDGKPCTIDSCDTATGDVLHIVKSCDDKVSLTKDSCDSLTGDCRHVFDCGGNCADDDACTKDSCDPDKGCVSEPMPCVEGQKCINGTCKIFCTENFQCSDSLGCTVDKCNLKTNTCEHPAQFCADNDATTFDTCVEAENGMYECKHIATPCTGGVDDGNPCTMDSCQNGDDVHQGLPCGPLTTCQDGSCGVKPCINFADCDDLNGCTTDTCSPITGTCHHELKSCGDVAVNGCDAATGECFVKELCQQSCDDGNLATIDACVAGKCKSFLEVECGPGTELNPMNGECTPAVADPTCIDGTKKCQDFLGAGGFSQAFCHAGVWLLINQCNPNSQICKDEQGCVKP